jgi:hypothetical protein
LGRKCREAFLQGAKLGKLVPHFAEMGLGDVTDL